MTWFNKVDFSVALCIFCLTLPSIVSIPVVPDKNDNKHLNDGGTTSGLKGRDGQPGNDSISSESTTKSSKTSEPEGGDYRNARGDLANPPGDDPMQKLASITDVMQQDDEFAIDGNIDYDSMEKELPKPEKLIKPEVKSGTPNGFPLVDLEFKEMHERAQYMRITEVKESILSKLRLLAPPNITALQLNNQLKRYPDHIVPALPNQQPDEDFQNDDSGYTEDNFHAKISTVIQFSSAFPDEKQPELYPTESIAYFSLPLSVSSRNVQKATLMVYISTPEGQEGSKIKLVISETQHKNKPFLNRTVTLSSRGHWEHVDVSEQAIDWAADEDKNYGLLVVAELNDKNIAYLNDDPLESDANTQVIGEDITTRPHRTPLIKFQLNAEEQGRYRRSFNEMPLTCDMDSRDNRCCRYKFVIDFQQLGKEFDFIIQPRRYLANYCAGSCPTYYLPKDGNSKLLLGLSVPKLQRCCSPMTKKALTILYYDSNGSMNLGQIPDMSIEKCHCS